MQSCDGGSLTASSTWPNSSNFWRRVASSVCQARPLLSVSAAAEANGLVTYPMKSFDMVLIERSTERSQFTHSHRKKTRDTKSLVT